MLERHGLTAANANGAGQTVAAGTLEQLAALAADPPAKARVIALQVAGAFHTVHMSPAVEASSELAADFDVSDPAVTLLSNADGRAVAGGADALTRLVRQVSSPVRWDLCMQTMVDLGVTAHHRAGAGRHPRRPRQARHARSCHTGRQDARRPRGGPAAGSRPRRRPRRRRFPPDRRARGLT